MHNAFGGGVIELRFRCVCQGGCTLDVTGCQGFPCFSESCTGAALDGAIAGCAHDALTIPTFR